MAKGSEAQYTWPKYVWMNGSIVRWEEAKVHVFVHGLHYGTGVFEGIRGYYDGGYMRIFRLDDHFKRLFRSAKILHMDIPYTLEDLVKATIDLVKINQFKNDIYIRPIAFRGLGSFGLRAKNPVDVAIIALEFGKYLKPDGIKCTISSWRKPSPDSVPIYAKLTGMYVLYHLASIEAALHGYDEAILLDSEGYVAEGSGENIFIVKNETLITPPVYDDILEGITRNTVITLAKEELGLQVVERRIRREELYTCDEAFFTGTAAEVTPIIEIDGRVIGDGRIGRITRKIIDLYRQVVLGRIKKYENWITSIAIE
ncbi:branched chain amino acid aminotransferase apoenzyme [Ignisphaera aggregans DSM 17230]|uniref:Branched-chain-amino-acid aminotransferase n=1 Tax=Ignisphaera aggregans (strain DSM 17230 / JCM 13409 / AQ1.S1) TaxID=583356 RepID=E0SNU7_IGNAA|nr:branched chain amino acid aminotransferase apoenzyme [Ignisphaera aggregans DSM 17230]